MRHWIKQPLLSIEKIGLRQDAVEALAAHGAALDHLDVLLDQSADIERLIMKISTGYASPRDLLRHWETRLTLSLDQVFVERCRQRFTPDTRPSGTVGSLGSNERFN